MAKCTCFKKICCCCCSSPNDGVDDAVVSNIEEIAEEHEEREEEQALLQVHATEVDAEIVPAQVLIPFYVEQVPAARDEASPGNPGTWMGWIKTAKNYCGCCFGKKK